MESTRLFDPATYADGVPYELIAEMRSQASIHWVEEPAVMGGVRGLDIGQFCPMSQSNGSFESRLFSHLIWGQHK